MSSSPTGHALTPPPLRAGTARIASVDVEWSKNYRIKNGQRPFCFSAVWLDLPTDRARDLADATFQWTSLYVEEPDEMGPLIQQAATCLTAASETADIVTGHQFCADLSVLRANAPTSVVPALERAREQWLRRRDADPAASRYVDTRYDTGHLLAGTSRRLVDVCTELGLDVTQPELRGASMPALHRRWIENGDEEGRERVSVLNLRHSVSTAFVAALTAELAHWPDTGLNVNRAIADSAKGAWGWLETPTFTALLEDSCPSATAGSSPSKALKRPARQRSSTR
ncbi:hypothetical protein [Streptomyces sp. NPDC046985]|uniref:hypothetical protein n=1 Tax=Streptomyces sp. NPDC046985 TaxID=3155377 RepID=UPI0033D94119